jgi:hypothetical protein
VPVRKIQDLSRQMKMNNWLVLSAVAGVCALGLATSRAAAPRAAQAPASSFPESLLEGEEVFDFALLMQGDARGNFGPCG